MLRVKESPTTSLVNRDIGTRWACRLAVELDVGELGSSGRAFVAEKPVQRLSFIGNMGAMVGVWSSLSKLGKTTSFAPVICEIAFDRFLRKSNLSKMLGAVSIIIGEPSGSRDRNLPICGE